MPMRPLLILALSVILSVILSACHSARHSNVDADISIDSTSIRSETIASADYSTIFSGLSLRLDSLSIDIVPLDTSLAPYRLSMQAKHASFDRDTHATAASESISHSDTAVNRIVDATRHAESQVDSTAITKPPDLLYLIIGLAIVLLCMLVYKYK